MEEKLAANVLLLEKGFKEQLTAIKVSVEKEFKEQLSANQQNAQKSNHDLTQKLTTAEKEIIALKNQVWSIDLDNQVAKLLSGNKVLPVVVKMSEFTEKKRQRIHWYSEPFLLHQMDTNAHDGILRWLIYNFSHECILIPYEGSI